MGFYISDKIKNLKHISLV